MTVSRKFAISPTRAEDYPQWYQEVIKAADMAENSVIRGCMVIKPWGYAIWERIQAALDKDIKATGHQNFYFPMFVPLSFMAKEAEHVEGFAKECAVVTHHRLEAHPEKGLVPAGPLEEPLVLRPTSEAIIGEAYSRWINSYRDLPLKGNQWANVFRWEMRPRIFLRTSEFLWQEGHTAHATDVEAIEESETMLEVYRKLSEDFLAMPVIVGKKTAREKFPGADITYCIESMMQDKKALQAGTSHFLGQHFSKAFNIKYLSKEGVEEFTWTTSWGVSTRLIGGLIMTHSDDDGLVLPPTIAPIQIVIVPITNKPEQAAAINSYCQKLKQSLETLQFSGEVIRVSVDDSDKRTGDKLWGWIKKGVPIRLEIGEKELLNEKVFIGRRDNAPSDKVSLGCDEFIKAAPLMLDAIQQNLWQRACAYRDEHFFTVDNKANFVRYFEDKAVKTGFVMAPWIGDETTEKWLKETYKVTARCMPLSHQTQTGNCIFTNEPNAPYTIFARSY